MLAQAAIGLDVGAALALAGALADAGIVLGSAEGDDPTGIVPTGLELGDCPLEAVGPGPSDGTNQKANTTTTTVTRAAAAI